MGFEGLVVRRPQLAEISLGQRRRKKDGERPARHLGAQPPGAGEVPSGEVAQLRHHVGKPGNEPPAKEGVDVERPVAARNRGQIDARSRGMEGDCAHQPRDRPGDTDVAGGLDCGVATDAEDLETEARNGSRDPFCVTYQRVRVRWRIAGKLGAAPIQKAFEVRPGQCEPADRFGKCDRHRVTGRIAREDTGHRVSPPLKTDLSRKRLADRVCDAGDFVIEGVDREQPLACVGPGEQSAMETAPVVPFHFARAMRGFRRHHWWRAGPVRRATPASAPGTGTDPW